MVENYSIALKFFTDAIEIIKDTFVDDNLELIALYKDKAKISFLKKFNFFMISKNFKMNIP